MLHRWAVASVGQNLSQSGECLTLSWGKCPFSAAGGEVSLATLGRPICRPQGGFPDAPRLVGTWG